MTARCATRRGRGRRPSDSTTTCTSRRSRSGSSPTPARRDRRFVERDAPAPFASYCGDADPGALDQMRNAVRLPVAVRGALMPDAHHGYGLPIGGVLATENAVIPYAVGVDIACRMKLSVLDIARPRHEAAAATSSCRRCSARDAVRHRRRAAQARRSRTTCSTRTGRHAGDARGCATKRAGAARHERLAATTSSSSALLTLDEARPRAGRRASTSRCSRTAAAAGRARWSPDYYSQARDEPAPRAAAGAAATSRGSTWTASRARSTGRR